MDIKIYFKTYRNMITSVDLVGFDKIIAYIHFIIFYIPNRDDLVRLNCQY